MAIVFILLSLVAVLVAISGWLWLCAGFHRAGWRGLAGTLALQLSGVCLAYGVIRGQPMSGVFTAALPPLAAAQVIGFVPFQAFLSAVARGVAPFAGGALVLCLIVPRLRVWSLGVTLMVALIAALFVGDRVSLAAMCQAATARGFTEFQRNSFMWSVANTPQEPQFELHAAAQVGEQRMGWSYAQMDWYVIPQSAAQNVGSGPKVSCYQAS